MIGRLLRRRRIHDDASAFVDGALSASEREAFAHHVAVCGPCRDELAQLRETKGALRALETAALPRSFALTPAMVAQPQAPSGKTRLMAGWGSPGMPRLAASASAMMAAALIAAVVIDFDDGSSAAISPPPAQQVVVAMVDSLPAGSGETAAVGGSPSRELTESSLLAEGVQAPVVAPTQETALPEAAPEPALDEVAVAAAPEIQRRLAPRLRQLRFRSRWRRRRASPIHRRTMRPRFLLRRMPG